MRRTTAIAIGTLTLALLCTGLATGAGSAGKGMCRGKAVTITEDRKGDPIGPGKDVVLGTRGRDVVNLAGGDDKFYGDAGNDIACAGPGEDLLLGGDDDDAMFGGRG